MSPLVVCAVAMAGIVALVAWMAWMLHRIDQAERDRRTARMYDGRRDPRHPTCTAAELRRHIEDRIVAREVPVTDAEWAERVARLIDQETS